MIVRDYKLDATPLSTGLSFSAIDTDNVHLIRLQSDEKELRETVKDGFSGSLNSLPVGFRFFNPQTGREITTIGQGGGLWYGLADNVLALGDSLLSWAGETDEAVAVSLSYAESTYFVEISAELLNYLYEDNIPKDRSLLFVHVVKFSSFDLSEEISSTPLVMEN